ncbi:MAG: YkoF family thiamine/hydroxymethylpyrimidine-binding protein [Steroidobacteraceae bacterium]
MNYNAPMVIGVEISLYPLAEQFAPEIHDFIARLAAAADLKVVSSSLSTQVFGDYERVFETLRRELRATFESRGEKGGKAAFVLKVLGPL